MIDRSQTLSKILKKVFFIQRKFLVIFKLFSYEGRVKNKREWLAQIQKKVVIFVTISYLERLRNNAHLVL